MKRGIDNMDIGLISIQKYEKMVEGKPYVSAVFNVGYLKSIIEAIDGLGASECVILLGNNTPILVKDVQNDAGICLGNIIR